MATTVEPAGAGVGAKDAPAPEHMKMETKTKAPRMKNQEKASFFLSWLIYGFMTDLILKGFRRTLGAEDLWDLEETDDAEYNYRQFREHFDADVKRWRDAGGEKDENVPKPSTGKALARVLVGRYIFSLFWQVISSGCQIAQPVLMQHFILYLRVYATFDGGRDGYLYAMGFCLLALLRSFSATRSQIMSLRTGIRARAIMIVAVYQKALRIGSSAADLDTGKTVSLMSNDAQRVFELFMFLNEALMGIPQLAVVLALLYQIIYAYTFTGFAVLVLILPLNGWAVSGMQRARAAMVGKTDVRTRLLNEVMQAIKVVKFYAWEKSFQKRIGEARNEELDSLKSFQFRFAIVIVLVGVTPTLITMISILSLAANNPLFPEIIFAAISYYQLVRTPLTLTPFLLSSIAQMNIALDRLRDFLMMEELDHLPEVDALDMVGKPAITAVSPVGAPDTAAAAAAAPGTDSVSLPHVSSGLNIQTAHSESIVSITNGTFKWPGEKEKTHSLTDVNMSCAKGQLIMVVGQVGSGKSTFVNAVLGEIPQLGGSRTLDGSVAYVPQQAWIMNATVRENILFGHPFDEKRYQETLDVCALRPDLEILRGGDLTEIGERGVNLSGGQKQRIAIARAVYSTTDVVLLDDPLSAVDAHVGRHLFNECIRKTLSDRAVIMVTNQLQYLPSADHILVIKNGAVVESGTYQQLMDQELEFAALVRQHVQEDSEQQGDAASKDAKKKEEETGTAVQSTKGTTKDADELVGDEDRQGGLIKFSTWLYYFKSPGTYLAFAVVLLGYLLEMGGMGVGQYWISLYTQNSGFTSVAVFLGVYAALNIGSSLFSLLRSLSFVVFSVAAGRQMHASLLAVVLRYPQSFFDTNPLGRIINRFTKDIDNLDLLLPSAMMFFLLSIFYCIQAIVIVAAVVPIVLVPIAGLGIVFYIVSFLYRKAAVDLQRLEAVSRSPLLSHFAESLAGRASIRSYRQINRFSAMNYELANANTRALLLLQQARQWLALRLDSVGALLLLIIAVLIVNGVVGGNSFFSTNASTAALALSQGLMLTYFFNFLTVQHSEAETKMSAVERINEYQDKQEEAPAIIESNRPAASWPERGDIVFDKVWMKYRPELPYVIEDLSFSIKGGEKIGVVGRTGAGKSSVMQLLFRIVDFTEGTVHVDGVNISKIGLEDLRRKLAIIPQEPFLFSGTVRSNLDPFEEYTDDQIWDVLRHIQLYELVSGFELKLLHAVNEGGENFSVGQRQLICLGRALLRRPRILLMDEATASVDVQTDSLIQKTVREQFADATVITIAHRLNTIIDYDRVMVLDKGHLAEFAAPGHLLQNPTSLFTLLVEDTGKDSAAMLRTLAMAKLGLAPPPLSPATTKRVADGMAEAAATAAAAEPAGLATEKTDVRVSMEQRSAAEAIAVGEVAQAVSATEVISNVAAVAGAMTQHTAAPVQDATQLDVLDPVHHHPDTQ